MNAVAFLSQYTFAPVILHQDLKEVHQREKHVVDVQSHAPLQHAGVVPLIIVVVYDQETALSPKVLQHVRRVFLFLL